jgi:hypothetical protein
MGVDEIVVAAEDAGVVEIRCQSRLRQYAVDSGQVGLLLGCGEGAPARTRLRLKLACGLRLFSDFAMLCMKASSRTTYHSFRTIVSLQVLAASPRNANKKSQNAVFGGEHMAAVF